MSKYGIPYSGSKGNICDSLIRLFPNADHFYDLFGGGFSVTHSLILNRPGAFKSFHFNEIRPGICDLIERAMRGEFNYSVFLPRFVTRQEFIEEKDSDPYVKMVWSFGNNGKGYIFGKHIEPYKRSMHNAVVFNEFDDLAKQVLRMDKFFDGFPIKSRRMHLRRTIKRYLETGIPDCLLPLISSKQLQQLEQLERLEQLQQLRQLERLQQLERLEQLQQLRQLERLQQLERLEFYQLSYEKVPIKESSIVYCDPPYRGTLGYGAEFDHDKFLNWCVEQTTPVFVSEYDISHDGLSECFTTERVSLTSSHSRKIKAEKVYVNEAGRRLLDRNPRRTA